MADQAKNILIGVFVISACAIITFILLFLHPSVGDEAQMLRVRFSDIDKINIGTRVNFAGKPVGEVAEIHELQSARDERIARNGIVYVYELHLAVDSGVNVYNSDEVAIRTSGLLGEKSVVITPMAPKPGQKLRVVNDEIIYADETGSVEDTFKEVSEVADKIEIALDALTENLNEITKQRIWKKIGKTSQNLAEITTSLNSPEDWETILKNMRELTDNALASWDKVDQALTDIQKTMVDARGMVEDGREILGKIKDGEGTIGKLLVGDETYLRLNSLLSKGETTMNDINHYGILFHLDKGWQRMRARRLNLMNTLSTPQEFRNYFNDEVDQISTSLSRVSMLLGKTDAKCPREVLIEDAEFSKVYAELMRRVGQLDEEIKMYNQQVVDAAVKTTELVTPRAGCCQ